ncbi:flagellar hook assembly protein FlgD [Candidatus Laterigemmans baculatus]|uniref:flagellar hook assembly protein FlgD n=1 Tax=Candidatus Laterigemmans baculatus TaxID=2770505 RepID=UPI0013D96A41|nr:flagellar hook capping FlgD N-terminal domain-containing protein [Candidatus Laterigemmans baculatus]
MSRIDGSTGAAASSGSSSPGGNGLSDIDMDSFLKLLISEMQNQDPMNPMDNAQMIQQISQIREIGATNQLTDSLSNLTSNQQMVTASSLIGREITGLGSAGDVTGVVDRVTVEVDEDDKNLRTVKVHVGQQTIDMKNIRQINSA